ncbi:MAG: Rpn family recombination-promoting nuclease/putative transposase, partial [Clostridiaceae bacterium]|nr:Rpn family recombination-promoting nuclease/putative transposase [Clostridiaceae bacterium]
MQKDITEKELVQCNDVFADIYNEGIFGGKKILREEDLLPLPTESLTRTMDGTLRQGIRDVRKADRRSGTYRLIWNLENQSGTDNTMPERVMGYEYASYEEQIKALMAENRKAGNPAVTKRIHDDQKRVPVITAVLNWGEREWSGPRHLHEMLKFPEGLEEELRPMAADYSFHLIEMGSLPEEVRNRFQSDFRVLAEYAATRKEPEKWEAFLREYPKKLDHPEELFDALKAVAGDERYEQIAEQLTKEEKEEGIRMCVVA